MVLFEVPVAKVVILSRLVGLLVMVLFEVEVALVSIVDKVVSYVVIVLFDVIKIVTVPKVVIVL